MSSYVFSVFYLGIYGFFGTISRYFLLSFFTRILQLKSYFSLLVVNTIGSFLIAYLIFYLFNKFSLNSNIKMYITVGFLGSFTTFSSFSMEVLRFLIDKEYFLGIAYALSSVALGICACFFGYFLSKI